MNLFKSLFAFDTRQRRGIFILILLLVIVLAVRFYFEKDHDETPLEYSVNEKYQQKIDSIKRSHAAKRDTIYPFNPNYITDYRGYKLGLSLEELDRLSRFRESGKFINSPAQFQQVTQVSDQWLDSISPYFKFPAWVNNRNRNKYKTGNPSKPSKPQDLNKATADQLKEVYGIGPALSKRIIEERSRLGGFIDIKQMRTIYGLTDSTTTRIMEKFYISKNSNVKLIALNQATKDELLSIPYFNDYLVNELIKQRTLRDGFNSWDEVMLTSRFPEEKLPLIQLYLTLD
ncbi:competence protein ComEA [Nonlabens spongiae]|uniref:Competence protein ComEA n=1 Tax=Nonlabens spongiae TaxID=331648 RepID=A0A1W6MNK6_9FLAO|nr:helix-hairpin-helix domain-containing protein [Nonlabens spongiae]ARN79188.1 competence protein ComEA [Nonlabens spongiae]